MFNDTIKCNNWIYQFNPALIFIRMMLRAGKIRRTNDTALHDTKIVLQ